MAPACELACVGVDICSFSRSAPERGVVQRATVALWASVLALHLSRLAVPRPAWHGRPCQRQRHGRLSVASLNIPHLLRGPKYASFPANPFPASTPYLRLLAKLREAASQHGTARPITGQLCSVTVAPPLPPPTTCRTCVCAWAWEPKRTTDFCLSCPYALPTQFCFSLLLCLARGESLAERTSCILGVEEVLLRADLHRATRLCSPPYHVEGG
eukprot:6202047-Pleurochrysis_carterae.AAC.3